MLETLLNVIAPVFLVIAVGALLARSSPIDVQPINRIALYAAVPALALRTLAETTIAPSSVLRLAIAYLAFMATMACVAWLLGSRLPPEARRGLIATSIFSNAANMMLPVTLFTLGDAGLQRALILYVLTSLLTFSLGPVILGNEPRLNKALRTALTFPVLWACLAGIAINLLGWTMPVGLERGVSLLSDAAVPLVLLTLGIQVSRVAALVPRGVNWLAAGVKLLIGPSVGYAIGILFGLAGLDLAVLTLLAAMPPAVNNVMLALEFGGDADQVGRTVILATLGALLSLPIVVAFFPT